MSSIDPGTLPEFADAAALIRLHAQRSPSRRAVVLGERVLDYAGLDALMDRVAGALQRDGLKPGDVIALCAATSMQYAAVFLGALRAGIAVAPLAPGNTPATTQATLENSDARLLFTDASVELLQGGPPRISLDDSTVGRPFDAWLAGAPSPQPLTIDPQSPFNIIYSSGTTGEPKGIVQSHAMRWAYARRAARFGYGSEVVALISTPLYSNTTLVVFFPALAFGGTVVLMRKFDVDAYLKLAQAHRVTHTMLVPVQYQRLLGDPEFDRFDLTSFRYKFSTSAPFPAALKAEALRRWPGALVEFYGTTEGGGSCALEAHLYPHKLHTVGRPAPGSDIRLIDEAGREVAPGETGEVVGRSPSMMVGYHKRPDATRQAEWFDAEGRRFIRSGDIGQFDVDGFLTLIDRRKHIIISGGFNIYPSDIEAVLREHPAVADLAVVGVPSQRWGETPVAFVVRRVGYEAMGERTLQEWVNARLGKMQRLHALCLVDELPRSAIGKVLKSELRERFGQA